MLHVTFYLIIYIFLLFFLTSVRFHLGHLFEMQNKCDLAQEMYETIIETPNAPNTVRANAYKQLGKYKLTSAARYWYYYLLYSLSLFWLAEST